MENSDNDNNNNLQDTGTNICIIGVGFVGLNLVNIFKQNKSFKIKAYDISNKRILQLQELQKANINDQGVDQVIYQSNIDGLEECDLFVVAVPTDINIMTKNLDLTNLIDVKLLLEKIAKRGSTIVIESSIYVGGTREFSRTFLDKGINIGFSPERLELGREIPTFKEIPKIISGINDVSLNKIKEYYSSVFDKCVIVSSLETAEMCKLYENCFRVVNIAYTNQIADMCDSLNINTNEMIDACDTKPYGFLRFNQGLGVGGYCLPYNPYYLMKNIEVPILKQSCSFLELRPYVKACEFLNTYKSNKILIIGLGFKTGESLVVNSPSVCFAFSLIKSNKMVRCYDPIVQRCTRDNSPTFIDFIHLDNYNEMYINENFDTIIITMNQVGIDYSILKKLNHAINIISFI